MFEVIAGGIAQDAIPFAVNMALFAPVAVAYLRWVDRRRARKVG